MSVRYETPEPGIALITIDRAQAMNALNASLLKEFSNALDGVAANEDLRVLILTGAGDKAFCSGFDIRSLPISSKGDRNERLKTLEPVDLLLQSLVNFPIPIIIFCPPV